MHRNPDRPGLIGNRPGYRLTNPPGRIGTEFISTLIFKFVNRLHQADITLLNQIQKLEAAIGIFFGNADNQTQIRFDQLIFSGFRLALTD